jgi:hypothetical protein
VKCAECLVQLAKEDTVLQGVIDRLVEVGRRCGMEMKMKKKSSVQIV